MSVEIHAEDVELVREINEEFLGSWFAQVTEVENKILGDVSVILTSDEYLLDMNKQYLDHDYFTDIITFDYTENEIVSGDLFISLDRVRDNASTLSIDFKDELHRVCVHGLLHLSGYMDKSEDDEKLMRSKEDQMLNLRVFHVEHLKF